MLRITAVYAVVQRLSACLSVRLSVCLFLCLVSVTFVYCVETSNIFSTFFLIVASNDGGYGDSQFSTNILLYLGNDTRCYYESDANRNSYAIYQMPFPVTLNDQISRSRHHLTLSISETVRDREIET